MKLENFERDLDVVLAVSKGHTLRVVGLAHGISGDRVRQISTKFSRRHMRKRFFGVGVLRKCQRQVEDAVAYAKGEIKTARTPEDFYYWELSRGL